MSDNGFLRPLFAYLKVNLTSMIRYHLRVCADRQIQLILFAPTSDQVIVLLRKHSFHTS